jgi:hypothetical protein
VQRQAQQAQQAQQALETQQGPTAGYSQGLRPDLI